MVYVCQHAYAPVCVCVCVCVYIRKGTAGVLIVTESVYNLLFFLFDSTFMAAYRLCTYQ